MKVLIEDLSSIEKKVFVEIPAEDVSKKIDEAFKKLGNNARVKGFRPGKVPLQMLHRLYGDQVERDVESDLLKDTLPKALEESNIKPISVSNIDKEDLKRGEVFKYNAKVEVKPAIEVKEYAGIELKKHEIDFNTKLVDEELKRLQEKHSTLEVVEKPEPVKEGDFVVFDYDGKIDGKPFKGGTADGVTMELGKGSFIKGFEHNLYGMRVDEEKEFDYTFPPDYADKNLAEKVANFKVRIKGIKKKILPPLDDDFAKDIGEHENLDALKEEIKEKILKRLETKAEEKMKEDVIGNLRKRHSFEVPPSLIENHLGYMINEHERRLRSIDKDISLRDEEINELRERFKERAREEVEAGLILEEIADREKIEVKESDIGDFYQKVAEDGKLDINLIKDYYRRQNLVPMLKVRLLEEKTLDFLIQNAKIINANNSLMQDGEK